VLCLERHHQCTLLYDGLLGLAVIWQVGEVGVLLLILLARLRRWLPWRWE
jgi:hypothetical protein